MKDNGNKRGEQILDVITKDESSSPLFKKMKLIEPLKMSPEEALALFINTDLTVDAYKLIRKNAKKQNHDLYPSYHEVRNPL